MIALTYSADIHIMFFRYLIAPVKYNSAFYNCVFRAVYSIQRSFIHCCITSLYCYVIILLLCIFIWRFTQGKFTQFDHLVDVSCCYFSEMENWFLSTNLQSTDQPIDLEITHNIAILKKYVNVIFFTRINYNSCQIYIA